jgi:Bacterial Ig-like domain (group 3)
VNGSTCGSPSGAPEGGASCPHATRHAAPEPSGPSRGGVAQFPDPSPAAIAQAGGRPASGIPTTGSAPESRGPARGQAQGGSSAMSTPASTLSTAVASESSSTSTVGRAASTATAVTASSASPVSGQRIHLIVTVAPAPAGGTVRFLADARPMAGCHAVAVSRRTGEAVCDARFATAGAWMIKAIYSGHGDLARSVSPVLTLSVRWSLRWEGQPRVRADGLVSTLTCASGSGGCPVAIELTVPRDGGAGAGTSRRPAPIEVGDRAVTVAAGDTRTLDVRLNPRGTALLTARRALALAVTLRSTIAGRRVTVATATVTMRR